MKLIGLFLLVIILGMIYPTSLALAQSTEPNKHTKILTSEDCYFTKNTYGRSGGTIEIPNGGKIYYNLDKGLVHKVTFDCNSIIFDIEIIDTLKPITAGFELSLLPLNKEQINSLKISEIVVKNGNIPFISEDNTANSKEIWFNLYGYATSIEVIGTLWNLYDLEDIVIAPAIQERLLESKKIPDWIKNNAGWWANGLIADNDFIFALQFLIDKEIIKVPATEVKKSAEPVFLTMVKFNAGRWANDEILDQEFLVEIQMLMKQGILKFPQKATEETIVETPQQPIIEGSGEFKARYAPVDPSLETMKETMKETGALEGIVAALNEKFVVPEDIYLTLSDCGGAINAYYDNSNNEIVICYDLLLYLYFLFSGIGDSEETANQLVGVFVFVIFHELGHALIDVYDLPITGLEEDAVDQLSVYLMMQQATPSTYSNLGGVAAWFLIEGTQEQEQGLEFWDEHSLSLQRFYNIACWTYGYDPVQGIGLIESGILPEDRAVKCPDEYKRLSKSWDYLLTPHFRIS